MSKILVIDDDIDTVNVIRLILTKKYHDVKVLSKCSEILNVLTSFNPSLILMDVWLGGLDGRELCKKIKEQRKDIDIILISTTNSNLDNFELYDAIDVLQKPFDLYSLCFKVDEAVKAKFCK